MSRPLRNVLHRGLWRIVYAIVWFFYRSFRIRYFAVENRLAAEKQHASQAYALAVWHENLFSTIVAHGFRRFCPLTSLSRDGDIVAYSLVKLGHLPVRGGSTKGGQEARDAIIREIGNGLPTAISVDGPRGPRRVCKPGIIDIARKSGCAVIPVLARPERFWVLTRSWDRFRLPKPFTRVAVRYGEPIMVPKDVGREEFEAIRAEIDRRLNEIDDRAALDFQHWKEGTGPVPR
jgi:lysophospholipid acyltransferase (LPLAT)-like uncharacterized protein